jgi:hypothetical protein
MPNAPRRSVVRWIADLNSDITFAWVTQGIPILLWLIGVYYTVRLFADMSQDTTTITNTAFGILAGLGALSLSAARTVESTDPHRDRFAYAGERFLHAALLVLSASLLKYALLSLVVTPPAITSSSSASSGVPSILSAAARIAVGSTVGVLFFFAMNFSHTGLVFLTRVLWLRVGRYKDWDSFC